MTDYVVYRVILLYADVFVSTGGYGGFLQNVHSVPMDLARAGRKLFSCYLYMSVLSNTNHLGGEDKPEVCMRGEWAGIAVNLKTNSPSILALQDGTNKLLNDGI